MFSKDNTYYRRITDPWLCVYCKETSCGWLSTRRQNGGLSICLDDVSTLLFQQQVRSYLLLLPCKSTDKSRRLQIEPGLLLGVRASSVFLISPPPVLCLTYFYSLSLPSSIPVKTNCWLCPAQENLIKGLKGYQVCSTSLEVRLCFRDLLAPEILHHAEEFDPGDCAVWINVHCAL